MVSEGSCIWGYNRIYGGWMGMGLFRWPWRSDSGFQFSSDLALCQPRARCWGARLPDSPESEPGGWNWRVLWMKQTRQYASYEMNLRKFNDVWIDVQLNQMCRFYTHVISYISTLLKSLHDIHAFHTPVIRVKWASCHRGRSHLVGDFNTSSKQNYPSGIL